MKTKSEIELMRAVPNTTRMYKTLPSLIRAYDSAVVEYAKNEDYEHAQSQVDVRRRKINAYTEVYMKNHSASLKNVVEEAYDILRKQVQKENITRKINEILKHPYEQKNKSLYYIPQNRLYDNALI